MNQFLKIHAQYQCNYNDVKRYGYTEAETDRPEVDLDLPVAETALVLVDCWNMHYSSSFEQRVGQIDRDCIAPVLAAARQMGMTVIHAPAPSISAKYPQSKLYAVEGEEAFAGIYGQRDAEWPPQEFIDRTGPYEQFQRDFAVPMKYWIDRYKDQDIDPAVKPIESDYVIVTANQMHRLLKDKGIVHLVYTGFATNMCLLGRDYGVRAMAQRGYNPIVLRDCTTAVEHHDTVDELWATRATLIDMEYYWAFTSSSVEFLKGFSGMKQS
jgi:nicotinamidase-related amidase